MGHKIRLHSHDVKYGSGSGQQSVTGVHDKEDVNSHWTIKGPEDKNYCKRGEPGDGGSGDTGDVWSVMCEGDWWVRGDNVMLKHVDTGAYLAASGQTFGRPINGQMEIVGTSRPDGTTKWRTQEGVYVHPTDFDPKQKYGGHDEL